MSILWNKVQNSVANLLGAIEGADIATAATNYAATQSTSTLRGADFVPLAIQDACIRTVMEIASDICHSAAHPETTSFALVSSNIASGATIPTASSGAVPRIGQIRSVKDSSNSRALRETTVDALRDYLAASSTVFNGYNAYYYAIDGNTILHTRSNAILGFCGFTRTTITVNIGGTDIIPLNDEHEAAIIAGAVAKLGAKETMYMALAQSCEQQFMAHRQMILSFPKLASEGQK